LETDRLEAVGAIKVGETGKIASADLSRVRLDRRLDAAVRVILGQDGVPDVTIDGRLLDVSDLIDDGDRAGDPSRYRLRLRLDRMKISEKLSLSNVRGSIVQTTTGGMDGRIDGILGRSAEVRIDLAAPQGGPSTVWLSTTDAGTALRAAGLYRDAQGGSLQLEAVLGNGPSGGVTGEARIEDLVVRSEATFRDVLQSGGRDQAGAEVQGSGIRFREIVVPFTYRDGVVTLSDAVAVSPLLGLKVSGTLDEDDESLDMVGVLSPAYGLTGVLNEVPVIGDILSGGRGEGILAMTFTMEGKATDPALSVNPLSLLAPGLLRRVFTGAPGDDGTPFEPPTAKDR